MMLETLGGNVRPSLASPETGYTQNSGLLQICLVLNGRAGNHKSVQWVCLRLVFTLPVDVCLCIDLIACV